MTLIRMNKFNKNIILFLLFLSSLFIGCAKHNAFFLKQGYHDITSHYNAYFNANELYTLTIKSIEESKKENYDGIIALYSYGTLEDTKAHDGEFTTVIDKSSKSIQLHTISNWSDDNFLLLGKAFFMKGEYKKAEESLRYITANFREGVDGRSKKQLKKAKKNKKLKAKKKKQRKKDIQKIKDGKDIRPKNSLLIHEPTKTEALVWLAKTYTANKDFSKASAVLNYIESDKTFIQNYDRDKELAYTYFFLEQNNYHSAITHLEKAISMFKSKKKKARYNFVLAQLYQKVGNKKYALKYFEESIKGNSNYEMVFNAQLNKIKLSNKNSSDKEDKLLKKLIKDSKNSDYLDQLYYERALIALKNKEKDSAKELLAKSIEASTKNTKQKAKSLELLAGIFYANEQFTEAQKNYAECLSIIDEKYENFKLISKRANVLNDLVAQLNTINKNDSLLIIAEMPQDEIEATLYQQAQDIIDAEINAKNNNSLVDKFALNDKVKNDGKWYFYSETAKKIGFAKFKQIWGDINLEDNWRRDNKTSSFDLAEDPKTEDEVYEERVDALFESMLAEIPNTQEDKKQFKDDIVKAHYNAANIYKYDLDNDQKAILHFNVITKKYSKSKYDAESLFNLYLLNKKLENKTASDKNKKLVLSKYPKSKYAKIINNPNYTEKDNSNTEEVENYYETTYQKYIAEDFTSVISRIDKSKTLFPNNHLKAKFDLLKAITLGKQKKYQPYVDGLEYVISTHKNTEEQEKASEMLAYLKGDFPKADGDLGKTPSKDEGTKEGEESNSLFDPNRDKNKEGFKLKFGKKDVLKIGINEDTENPVKGKSTPTNKENDSKSPTKPKIK